MFTIGDLSRSTGVKIPTIRYYEQMGLLSHSERSEGNQRRYSGEEQERLSFIRHARELGLGSGLIAHSQKITVAARAMAERKAIGHRS